MASKDVMKGEKLSEAMERVGKDKYMSKYTKAKVTDKLKKRVSATGGYQGANWDQLADASED